MPGLPEVDESFASIIVAAGSGTRYGRPKHDLTLGGRPLWKWSVEVFENAGAAEIVVVGDVPGGVQGGRRRRDSVQAGLGALSLDAPIVLIHDAARPLLDQQLVRSVLETMRDSGADGVIPAIAITDTVKRTDGDRIAATVDRKGLVAVQTPQGFLTDALREAHNRFPDDNVTDDAALIERAGGTVVIVEGDRTNMKVTFPGDLVLAEAMLQRREP